MLKHQQIKQYTYMYNGHNNNTRTKKVIGVKNKSADQLVSFLAIIGFFVDDLLGNNHFVSLIRKK